MEAVKRRLKEEKNAKDEDVLVRLQLVNEMLVRGYEFLPHRAGQERRLQVYRGGRQGAAALLVPEGPGRCRRRCAGKRDPPSAGYLSIEELQQASGVGSSIIDRLRQVGALGDLPESSQVSFF